MIDVPKIIKTTLFYDSTTMHPTSIALLTSAIATPIISTIDTTVICPIIRMATLQTTLEKNVNLKDIFQALIRKNAVSQLYRGYAPLWIQTSFLWGSFFLIDDLNKSALKRYFGDVSYPVLALASIVGGGAQTLINIVPDTIRVQMQKFTRDDLNNLSMRETAKKLVKRHGFLSLFSAAPIRLVGGIIGYGYKSLLRYYWSSKEDGKTT